MRNDWCWYLILHRYFWWHGCTSQIDKRSHSDVTLRRKPAFHVQSPLGITALTFLSFSSVCGKQQLSWNFRLVENSDFDRSKADFCGREKGTK
ncbi:hypothetical protein BSKO_00775 [Bryopsis sp. KO-2023]|nr:hypothetical protein BSKO_00775 [Bryopsis sp. KO-2023]